jgi:cyclopropane fatty-acyl-phospholipid synthase-like methyltransferase
MTATFDPVAYKDTTRAQWEEAAAAWHAWGPTLETWLAQATSLMLDAAGIHTGSAVLDVAAGAGGQSLAAARRAGPSGTVLATYISPPSCSTPRSQPPTPGSPPCTPENSTANNSTSSPPPSTR